MLSKPSSLQRYGLHPTIALCMRRPPSGGKQPCASKPSSATTRVLSSDIIICTLLEVDVMELQPKRNELADGVQSNGVWGVNLQITSNAPQIFFDLPILTPRALINEGSFSIQPRGPQQRVPHFLLSGYHKLSLPWRKIPPCPHWKTESMGPPFSWRIARTRGPQH